MNMPTMQHFDVVSPPLSGRSTPKAHVPNVMPRGQDSGFNMHKYHTVSLQIYLFKGRKIMYFRAILNQKICKSFKSLMLMTIFFLHIFILIGPALAAKM